MMGSAVCRGQLVEGFGTRRQVQGGAGAARAMGTMCGMIALRYEVQAPGIPRRGVSGLHLWRCVGTEGTVLQLAQVVWGVGFTAVPCDTRHQCGRG